MDQTNESDRCYVWRGKVGGDGYGRIWVDGREQLVHRWVMRSMYGGDAIEGRTVRHRCSTPACFRLTHLEVGDDVG